MLPLALIVQGFGDAVSGSDRSRDQGRTPDKFAWLESQGVTLYPQDGSGVSESTREVIVSTAIEDSIPDVAAAKARNIPITTRPELLARLFNKAETAIAVTGTSGKSTVTGMIAFILHHMRLRPTVMNGAVMRDFASHANPFASALVGGSEYFVAEVDESTGLMHLYNPDIAVVTNIELDHMEMDKLRTMFLDFCNRAGTLVLNADHAETRALAERFADKTILYSPAHHPELELSVPGAHNRANAAAALGVVKALGLDVEKAVDLLKGFTGIKRRLETVGTEKGVTVIDDFAHNPDKIAASMASLKSTPGRLLILFQPHGYQMLRQIGKESGEVFAKFMGPEDKLYLTQPLYLGGTADKSAGPDVIAQECNAQVFTTREQAMPYILQEAKEGDRIVVMGARDDSLSVFADHLLQSLGSKKQESP